MGRTSRSRRTSQSSSSPKNESEGNQDDWDVDVSDTEVSIGFDAAGFAAEITIKDDTVELTLGIGIASVTLDLTEPNNSSISYAFDIFEIEGKRDGCTVKLEYKIGGVVAKEETRTIPECEKEEPPKEPPKPPPGEGEDEEPMPNPPYPKGDPMDLLIRFNCDFRDIPGYYARRTYAYLEVLEWSSGQINTTVGRYGIPTKAKCIVRWSHEVPYGKIQEHEKTIYLVGESYQSGNYNYETMLPIRQSWPPVTLYFRTGEFDDRGNPLSKMMIVKTPAMNFPTAGYFGYRWEFDRVTQLFEKAFNEREVFSPSSAYNFKEIFFEEIIIKSGGIAKNPPSPPPRSKGKIMDDKCCLMVKQIWEVLRAEEILEKGYPIPNRLMAPGGQKERKPKDYPSILKCLIQMLDKGLIGDFTATIEDSDLSTPGNQSQSKTFPDATASQQEIVQFLMQNKADDAVLQDILIRQTILQAEIMEALMETQSIVKCLLVGLGLPYKDAVGSFRMPVDIDIDPDKPAEKNLTEFLQESEKQYEAVNADLTSDTLWFYVTMTYLRNRSK